MARRQGQLALGAAFAALLLAGPATTAEAGVTTVGGYKYVEKDRSVPTGGSKRFRMRCPGDTFALSGGYDTTTAEPNNVVLVDRQVPGGWLIVADNQSATIRMDLTVEVVCSAEKPEYRTKKHRLDPSAQTHVTPECKGGELATDMALTGLNPVNSIFPTSSGGFTGYVDNLEAEEERIKSLMVCVDDRSARRVSAGGVVGAFGSASIRAMCPRNRLAVSGGQSNAGSFDQIRQVSAETSRLGRGFRAVVHNSTAGPISFTAYALCL